MKHLGHLIRWDVRRMWLILAVWILVVVGYTVLVGVRPYAASETSVRESVAVLDSVLWLTMVLLTFALVSFVIHGHPTVGTDAFWMTRPVAPAALLASKLALVAFALLAVPVSSEAVLLAVNRMAMSTSLGVLAQATSIRIVVITLLVIAAVLTRNLPRFALLCGAALLSVAAAIGISVAVMLRDVEERPPEPYAPVAEDPSALVVFNALFVIAAVVMLAVQYHTRLKQRSVTVGALGVTVALLIAWVWPIPFFRQQFETPDWAQRMTIRVDPATISTNRPEEFFASRRFEWATVNGRVHIDGPVAGWIPTVALRDAEVRLSSGLTLRSRGSWRSTAVIDGFITTAPEHSAARDILGVTTLATYTAPRPDPLPPRARPVLFVIRRDEVGQHLPASGHYRGRIYVHLTHYVVEGAIPVRPGAAHQNGGYRLVIDRTTVFDNEFAIIAREARATSMWERRPWARYAFYLRNRERGEAVVVNDYTLRGGFSLLRFLPVGEFSIGSAQTSGFSSRGLVLRTPPRSGPRAVTLDLDDAWFDGAELVVVRQTEEGWVERFVEIPNFPIGQ